jgi:hypothetical protein
MQLGISSMVFMYGRPFVCLHCAFGVINMQQKKTTRTFEVQVFFEAIKKLANFNEFRHRF